MDIESFRQVIRKKWNRTQREAFDAAPEALREAIIRDMHQMHEESLDPGEEPSNYCPQLRVAKKVWNGKAWRPSDMFWKYRDSYLFEVGYYLESGTWAEDLSRKEGLDIDDVYSLLEVLAG